MSIQVAVKVMVKEPERISNLTLPDGSSALDALCEAADVETKGYPDRGAFVAAVDGVRKKIKYTVNGEKFDEAISRRRLKDGDSIEVFLRAEH